MRRLLSSFGIAALVTAMTGALSAQSPTAPVLNQGAAGDQTVSGKAAPNSGPIRIYDVSNTPRTSIEYGQTSIDSAGNFAVSVNPALIQGHQIVAEDRQGRSSVPMTVKASDSPGAKP